MKNIEPYYSKKDHEKRLIRMGYSGIVLLALSIILLFTLSYLFKNAIVSGRIIACVWFIPSLLITFITTKLWFHFLYTKRFIVRLIGNTIFFGGLFMTLFLTINNSFIGKDLKTHKFKIISKSFTRNKNQSNKYPLFQINYFGIIKEIRLNYTEYESVNEADSVTLTVFNGKLGCDVIEGIYLINSDDNWMQNKTNSDIPKWDDN